MAIMAVNRGQAQQKQEEDPVDKVIKGLQIASSMLGIATNYQQYGLQSMQKSRLEQEVQMDEQLREGKVTPETFQKLMKVQEGDPAMRQAVKVSIVGDDSGQEHWVVNPAVASAQLQLEKFKMDSDATKAESARKQSSDLFDFENKLRNEYEKDPVTQNTKVLQQSFDAMTAGAAMGPGVGDIAVMNGFQRMVDPGMGVREGDVALQQMAQGYAEKGKVWMQQLSAGGVLGDQARQQMLAAGRAIFERQLHNQKVLVDDNYRRIATGYKGVRPEQIINPYWEQAGALIKTGPKRKSSPALNVPGGSSYYPPVDRNQSKSDPLDAIIEQSRIEATIPGNTLIRK